MFKLCMKWKQNWKYLIPKSECESLIFEIHLYFFPHFRSLATYHQHNFEYKKSIYHIFLFNIFEAKLEFSNEKKTFWKDVFFFFFTVNLKSRFSSIMLILGRKRCFEKYVYVFRLCVRESVHFSQRYFELRVRIFFSAWRKRRQLFLMLFFRNRL